MSSEKNVNDFIGKYFSKVYFLPQLDSERFSQQLKSLVYQSIEKHLSRVAYESAIGSVDNKVVRMVTDYLDTIRKIKAFKNAFEANLIRLKDDMDLSDLVVVSVVESTCWELFKLIKNYKGRISAVHLVDVDRYSNLCVLPKTEFKRSIQEFGALFEKLNGNDEVFFFLFPNMEIFHKYNSMNQTKVNWKNFRDELQSISNEIEVKQKIAHPLVLNKYFQSVSPEAGTDILISKQFKSKILEKCNTETPDLEDIAKDLDRLFPEGSSYFKLRELSLNWIDRIIAEKSEIAARNILFAIAILARTFSNVDSLMSIGEKNAASFLLWKFIQRFPDKQDTLVAIQSVANVSDIFTTSAVFYALNPDRTPYGIRVNEDIQNELVLEFLKQIEKKLKDAESVFDFEVFDAPTHIVWRWHNSTQFIEEKKLKYPITVTLYDHLRSTLYEKVEHLDFLLTHFVESDYGDEIPISESKQLKELHILNVLGDVYNFYKQQDLLNNLSKHNLAALKREFEKK